MLDRLHAVAHRRRTTMLALAMAASLLALGACGGSDDDADATDETVSAATATEAPTTAPETVAAALTGAEIFEQTCQGCHADGGRRAAFGPQLAGAGLTAAQIRTTVVNGRGQMPAGLVEGPELRRVVAYVLGLQ